ncbi:MAG: hypothetical protein FWD28_09630 [Treponema sp.]|nr:hypothetical protein [Treponema sp.]
MKKLPLIKLELCNPIIYQKDLTQAEGGEMLLCFEVNPAQGSSIEPKKELFLGNLVFSGAKAPDSLCDLGASVPLCDVLPKISEVSKVILPIGHYLFVQSRGNTPLKQEEWLDLAIEQQKDGLWERNKLANLLYIRFLYEDEAHVTQVFRPIEN